jgi:GDPmannose 4,6-dehydratase
VEAPVGETEPSVAQKKDGDSEDYVDGMFRILQHHEPDDFVLATGETHSVREFLDAAFKVVGIDDWTRLVEQDPKYFRPTEVDLLLGDSSRAQEILKWQPKWTFEALVEDMVRAELDAISPGEKR